MIGWPRFEDPIFRRARFRTLTTIAMLHALRAAYQLPGPSAMTPENIDEVWTELERRATESAYSEADVAQLDRIWANVQRGIKADKWARAQPRASRRAAAIAWLVCFWPFVVLGVYLAILIAVEVWW